MINGTLIPRVPNHSIHPLVPVLLYLLGLVGTFSVFADRSEVVLSAVLFFTVCTLALEFSRRLISVLSWHFLVPLYYLIFMWAIPLYEQATGTLEYTELRELPTAYLLLTVGILAFSISAWLSKALIGNRSIALTERKPLAYIYRFDVAVTAFAIAWIAKLYSIVAGYYGLFSIEAVKAEPTWYFGILSIVSGGTLVVLVVSWYQKFAKSPDHRWRALAWIALVTELIGGIFAASKGALVWPVVLIFVIRFMVVGQFKVWHGIAFLVFAIGAVFPFVSVARILSSRFDGEGRLEYLVFLWNVLISADWVQYLATDEFTQVATQSLGRRLLYVFTVIISWTGVVVPFLEGYTYETAFGILVPRFIWPDKPEMNIGNFIGRQYDFIAASDWLTNISPSQPGELYMNFGWIGVVIGMALWGIVATGFLWLFGVRSWYTALLVPAVTWHESIFMNLLLFPRNLLIIISIVLIGFWIAKSWELLSSHSRPRIA